MALKECPKCHLKSGPRTKTCECGHPFFQDVPTYTPSEVQVEPAPGDSKFVNSEGKVVTTIVIPAGLCPVKPNGFTGDLGWKATDEQISEWALAVVDSGTKRNIRYHVDAVMYWARYFWDIHAYTEFERVRRVIQQTINPKPTISITE